jgi:hypothetical protein
MLPGAQRENAGLPVASYPRLDRQGRADAVSREFPPRSRWRSPAASPPSMRWLTHRSATPGATPRECRTTSRGRFPWKSGSCSANTSASRTRAGSSCPTPPRPLTSTTTPSAIPVPADWSAPTGSAPRPYAVTARAGKSWDAAPYHAAGRLRSGGSGGRYHLASVDSLAGPGRAAHRRGPGGRFPGAGHRGVPLSGAAGIPDGEGRWSDLHRHLHALDRPRGGPRRGRRRPPHPRTRARWIALRRWVAGFEGGRFRLLGTPERSWDWPHVELADRPLASDRSRAAPRGPEVSPAITLVA